MPYRSLHRNSILTAAISLAEEVGLDNLTLQKLAVKLGVKPPSLYNHIGGTKDLMTGMAGIGLVRFTEAIRDAAIGKSKDDALLAVSFAYRRFAKENPELYKCIMCLPQLGRSPLQESIDTVVRTLLVVLEPYQLKKPDAMHLIRIWKSAIHGFITLEATGFFKAEYDIEESFSRLTQCLLKGMHASF
jgi:Transcriptional regulator